MSRRRRGKPINGWMVVNKPAGPTSTDVVAKVRRVTGAAKVGHGGTLDPLASGVLPIALGEATKTMSYAVEGTKIYWFRCRWGIATATDDAEGAPVRTSDHRPARAEIESALPEFIGEISQRPPAYSAIKVGGQRAYDRARDGEEVVLQPRLVRIHDLRLVGIPDADHAELELVCGKGTYVRSLARDLGERLGTAAHVVALERRAVGPFTLDAAVDFDQLAALAGRPPEERVGWDDWLLPVETPLDDIPAVALSALEVTRLRNGQPVMLLRRSDRARLAELEGPEDDPAPLALATDGTKPVGFVRLEGGELKPVRLLNL